MDICLHSTKQDFCPKKFSCLPIVEIFSYKNVQTYLQMWSDCSYTVYYRSNQGTDYKIFWICYYQEKTTLLGDLTICGTQSGLMAEAQSSSSDAESAAR